MTEQPTCRVGSGTGHPCQNPAVATMPYGGPPACEGHKLVFESGADQDELHSALGYLGWWIRTADRYGVVPLQGALRTLRDGFAAELAELDAKERELAEQYSLPPDGLEQLNANQRGEEPTSEPE